MLTCEGYKMFFGAATVVPNGKKNEAYDVIGTWLYKPEFDRWCCAGNAYPATFVTDIRELSHD